MTATVTVLRYGPEKNGRLAYPEGYDTCLRLRDLYTKQKKGARPLFHFVAATLEEVSQETAQRISDASRIEGVDCVNCYGLDAYVSENYVSKKEGGIAEAVGEHNHLRRLGGEAGDRLYRFINGVFNLLEDGQHGLVIVDGFDLAFWARKTMDLQALKDYKPLTGYKGTRSTPGGKVFYRGISPLEATTSIDDSIYHLPLPETPPWVELRAHDTLAPDNEVNALDNEPITLDLGDRVHKNSE